MKTFNSNEEVIKYGRDSHLTKHEWYKVLINRQKTILCGTDMAYEEEVWGDIYELLNRMLKKFEIEDVDDTDVVDETSELRDEVLNWFEKTTGYKFLDVCKEKNSERL